MRYFCKQLVANSHPLARMLLTGATEFKRSHWFVNCFAAMESLSSKYMDGF